MRLALVGVLLFTIGCGGNAPSAPSPTHTPTPAPTPAPTPSPAPLTAAGIWAGTWVRVQCTEEGGATGACARDLPTSGGLRVSLTQGGSTVQGTVEIGTIPVPIAGTVGDDGVLRLTGSIGNILAVTTRIIAWESSNSATAMVGSFVFTIVPDDRSFGTATISASLLNVTKIG